MSVACPAVEAYIYSVGRSSVPAINL